MVFASYRTGWSKYHTCLCYFFTYRFDSLPKQNHTTNLSCLQVGTWQIVRCKLFYITASEACNSYQATKYPSPIPFLAFPSYLSPHMIHLTLPIHQYVPLNDFQLENCNWHTTTSVQTRGWYGLICQALSSNCDPSTWGCKALGASLMALDSQTAIIIWFPCRGGI